MNDANIVINAVFLLVYTGTLALNTFLMTRRIFRFRRARMTVPPLLWRDVSFWGTATFTLVLLLAVRAYAAIFDEGFQLRDQTWWLLVTGVPPVIGMAVWTYFEAIWIPANERRGEDAYFNR